MIVTERTPDGKLRTFNKAFTVHASQCVRGSWEYQLKDPLTGILYEGSEWFPERKLKI